MKTENGNLKIARKAGVFALMMMLIFSLTNCSDGGTAGSTSSELVTRYSYNLTRLEDYYYASEFHAYYQGNYVYTVHDCIFHYFLKTSSRYNNKTGTELCNIAKNRSIVPNSKTKDIVEGNKQVTINQTQSDGSTKVITMNIPDGTAYETWIYK